MGGKIGSKMELLDTVQKSVMNFLRGIWGKVDRVGTGQPGEGKGQR